MCIDIELPKLSSVGSIYRSIFKTFCPNSNLVCPWILYPPHPMQVQSQPLFW